MIDPVEYDLNHYLNGQDREMTLFKEMFDIYLSHASIRKVRENFDDRMEWDKDFEILFERYGEELENWDWDESVQNWLAEKEETLEIGN